MPVILSQWFELTTCSRPEKAIGVVNGAGGIVSVGGTIKACSWKGYSDSVIAYGVDRLCCGDPFHFVHVKVGRRRVDQFGKLLRKQNVVAERFGQ
jgi:hypothetical protein